MPVVALTCAWFAGVVASLALPLAAWHRTLAVGAVLAGGAALLASWPKAHPPPGRWPMALALLAASLAGLSTGPRARPPHAHVPRGLARVEGTVEQVRRRFDGRAMSVLRVSRGRRLRDGSQLGAGLRVRLSPVPLPQGARVRVLAKLRPWAPFRNPSPHPRPPPADPVTAKGWVPAADAVQVLSQPPLARLRDRLRERLREALVATLPARSLGIARALVLGESTAVSPDDRERVRAAGLAHVLAVSGLHISLLAGLMVALVQRLLLSCSALAGRLDARRIGWALGIPIALGLASVAGGAASAWRAAMTASIGWGLLAAGLKPRAATVASAAILVVCITERDVLRPGVLLSVVATAAILSGASHIPRGGGGGGATQWLRDAFTLSARTTIATAPVVLWYFGTVAWIGVVANVVLLPLASVLLLPLAAGHAVLAASSLSWLPWVSRLTGHTFDAVARAFLALCEAFASVGFADRLPPPDVWQGVTLAGAAIAWLLTRGLRARATVAACCVVALLSFEWRLRHVEQPTGRLRVTYLDVGQGDSALVDLPDGRLMLIDAGGNPAGGVSPGRAVLLPLLAARRRSHIDIAVLSHPHPDHYGGLGDLLPEVSIGELWDSGQAEAEARPGDELVRMLDALRARGTRVRGPRELCRRAMHAGGVTLRVLWPCPGYDAGYDPNDNSLVVRLEYGARSFLFTGDIEAHAETALLARQAPLDSDVLKVAHHGSRTSSSEAFLRATQPSLAIISAGASNHFGHPAPEVERRLQRHATRVIRLDRQGGTIVSTDGHELHVEPTLDAAPPAS